MYAVRLLLLLCAATTLVSGQQSGQILNRVLNNRCVKLVSKADEGQNTGKVITDCLNTLRHLSGERQKALGKKLVTFCVANKMNLVGPGSTLDTGKLRNIINNNPKLLGAGERSSFLQKLSDCDRNRLQLVSCMDHTCPGIF